MKDTQKSAGYFSDLVKRITDIFARTPFKKYNYNQISHQLNIPKKSRRDLVIAILEELCEQKILKKVGAGKYSSNIQKSYVEGTIDRQSVARKTYLIPDNGSDNIFIAERSLNCALNGDKVKVMLYPIRKNKEIEGEVVEIIQRANTQYVGILEEKQGVAFLKTDKKQIPLDIIIPKDKLNGAKNRQKCIAVISLWEDKYENPMGEIVDVLGNVGENNTEMCSILAEFGLPYKYPEEIDSEVEKIDVVISEEEIAKRIDFRGVTTFTIDPKDAKDFDDALSIQKLANNVWEVGVHIADVTHYVKQGDIIDNEAESRATSVYLVDRTIPMLPERLSNHICSLRPNEEKLTYSCIFKLNENANILDYKISRTVIKSDRRFTYEEVQQILDSSQGDFAEELLQLNKLAETLRQRRFDSGAIAFERSEVKFELDANGKPVSVYFKDPQQSNKLIEEFMLLANKSVAKHIGKHRLGEKPKPFVYRVHDVPNPDKLNSFADFIKRFGYKIKTDSKKTTAVSSSINHLLDEVEGKKEQNLIENLAIRSMAKAVYSTKNIGHYGLAMRYYTHFTSPIRRYPDMIVHRLLTKYATGKNLDKNNYEDICKHSSEMEQRAAQAERASTKYKQIEFMSNKVGQSFDGTISGVNTWGIYVEINENKCEGMIYIRDLEDDIYLFDEKNYCIIGKRSRKRYQIGDSIRIRVKKADLIKKYLDFEIVK